MVCMATEKDAGDFKRFTMTQSPVIILRYVMCKQMQELNSWIWKVSLNPSSVWLKNLIDLALEWISYAKISINLFSLSPQQQLRYK